MSVKELNHWLVYCAVVLALTGLAWIIPATDQSSVERLVSDSDDAVGGELSQIRAMVFSPNGDQLYSLESERLHYVKDQAMLEPVQIVYISDDGGRISVQASSGRVLEEGDLINLEDDVEIKRFLPNSEGTEAAMTSNVEIDMKARMARSEEHTVIRRLDHTASGDGIEVDMDLGKMRILGNVKIRHRQR